MNFHLISNYNPLHFRTKLCNLFSEIKNTNDYLEHNKFMSFKQRLEAIMTIV